jgi:hypothetical protein
MTYFNTWSAFSKLELLAEDKSDCLKRNFLFNFTVLSSHKVRHSVQARIKEAEKVNFQGTLSGITIVVRVGMKT